MPQTRYALPILLAALLAGGAVRAQQPASPRSLLTEEMTAADRRIMQEVRQSPHLMANLEYLCDMIGPRLTGSAKLRRANEWTLQKFREYGLTNAHLEGYTIPTAWTRGHASARVLEPTEQSLTIASAGWAPSTPGPVRGEVIYLDATDEAGLEKYRGRLRGAILLTRPPREIPLPAPPTVTGVPTPLPAEPVRRTEPPFPSSAFRRRLAEFVKSEGAACIFYDSGLEHSLLNMTSRGGPEPFTPGEVPAAFITSEGYRLLWRLLKRGTTRVEVEIKNSFSAGPVEVFNTVAEIPGSERPEEVVILGAHLDSWDLGTGATDNGTGSMAVLEAARAIQSLGLRPKRTLRFILFTGEEQGLVGSREYVKAHSADAARISGILVHDYGTGKVNNISLQGQWACGPILDEITRPLRAVGFEGVRADSLGGTDHLSFISAGVPGFACYQDPAEYRKTHHSPSDTLDKVWPDDLKEGAMVLAVWAYNVAGLPELLPRTEGRRQG